LGGGLDRGKKRGGANIPSCSGKDEASVVGNGKAVTFALPKGKRRIAKGRAAHCEDVAKELSPLFKKRKAALLREGKISRKKGVLEGRWKKDV